MAYLLSSESESGTTDSSELSFLRTSSEEDLPDELRERNESGKYPKKKVLKPEQQSLLLVRKNPVGLFPDRENPTKIFKRERKAKRHTELDEDPNRGKPVSLFEKDPVNPPFHEKWARTAKALRVPVIGDRRRGFAIREPGKELEWRPDRELMTPPMEEPTSFSIYNDGYMNPVVHIPLRIEQIAEPSRRDTYIPIIRPSVHALEGGIVHVFDSRSLRTYRLFDRQEFDLIASLRFDEMRPDEQLTCLSYVPTRHSIALGFADGNAAICRVEIDNSTQIGRGRHNFEYVVAPAEAHLVITKIEQNPCTARFIALCYYDAPRMSYVIRVIDLDRLLDKDKNVLPAGDKAKEFFSQYLDGEDFGARQGPFRTVDGKESIPMMDARQHTRILSVRTSERVTDLMWFSDRRNLLMVFTERTMRLFDISKEEKEKLLKSCTLSHPLTYPTVHPGMPSLFSALDRHRIVIFDRRCLKSPIAILNVPTEALGRGVPSLAVWCPSDMNKLFIHYRSAQRAAIIQFNRYPDCSQLSDGGCEDSEVSPLLNKVARNTVDVGDSDFHWPYNIKDEFPITLVDHLIAEDDLEGCLMEAVPFPDEWKQPSGPLLWRPEFEVTTLPYLGSGKNIRRIQSEPDVTSADNAGNFVHPFKRYSHVARNRRADSVFRECVEWRVWDQLNGHDKRRTKSEERPKSRRPLCAKYAEEEDLIRPFPVVKTSPYLPHLEKNEIVYPVFTSEFVDMPELETILKMEREPPKKLEYFAGRPPPKAPVFLEKIDYENAQTTQPPGPVMPIIKSEQRFDVPLNYTRIPLCHGGLYYGIQGRPIKRMRSAMDHAKFYDTHDATRNSEMTKSKKKRLMKEKRRDEIMRLLLDEEEDLMSANDCRWINLHESARGGCDPAEHKVDPFVQTLRKSRIHDSDDSDNASSIDPHDDSLRRVNFIRDITKNDFAPVEDRSLFDVNKVEKRPTKEAWNAHLFELPVEDPQSFCLFTFSMEMIVQGAPSDVHAAPNSVIVKIVLDDECEPPKQQQRLCFPQLPDMSTYLRSVLGINSLQSVKLVKISGFGEFIGEDIPKGYIQTLKHLRKHLEDSDGNRFALDYIERLFNDNHISDHDRGFPLRFNVADPIYSDTTDEDDPKKKKKKIVFSSVDDRPKMEQLKEKLYKKNRQKFLKRRRACEELKFEYETVFPQEEVRAQKSLTELYDKGDPKRSILQDPVPPEIYEMYSGTSDSNEEAHYLPTVSVRKPSKRVFDFEEEEQIIARETKEIELIQDYRKRGKIPPFEFHYDEDGNMIRPKKATLEEEYHQNIQTTRTLLRRILERDARIHELKRRREIMLDRLPEEVAEDTYDHMMSDLKSIFDEMEPYECNLSMRGDFFKNRQKLRRRTVYGLGWRRNRLLQHKFLNQSMNLCDYICRVRIRYQAHKEDEKRRNKALRTAQKEAKKLMREIARRDVSGDYMKSIHQVQFRRHAQLRDFDLYDFLESFEEVTLKMCGRQYSAHSDIVRMMTHLRKDRLDRMDPKYNEDMRPKFTAESDSDFEQLQVSSVSADSSSSLSGQPVLTVKGRKKRLTKKRHRKPRSESAEKKAKEESELMDGVPVASCEVFDKHPEVFLPKTEKLFYEKDAASLPITSLVRNRVDPLKQLASFSRGDIMPPERAKQGRPKGIKNRKQRNKRDRRRYFAEQARLRSERNEEAKKAMDEIVVLMERICISTTVERQDEWRRRRDERMTEGLKNLTASPGRLTPHRSITRKLLDKLRIGGGPRPIRVYANGSIYPPPKIPFSRIFDKFDHHTNPFARKPAANPEGPRPRPTFFDDGNIEIGVAVGSSNIFPPDEFGFPLRIAERIPNNVMWMFPKYWSMRLTRRLKQQRKRKRRWLSRCNDDISQYFSRDRRGTKYVDEDEDSISTNSTRIGGSIVEIPDMTADEKYMAKFMCIANPGIPRAVSCMELSTRDEEIDHMLRPRSCMARLTNEMESLDAVESAFAGSQELPPPPGLFKNKEGRLMWIRSYHSFEDHFRKVPTNVYEDFADTRPMPYLLSPLDSSDEEVEEEEEVTPVPPPEEVETPTEFTLTTAMHTNTPDEVDEVATTDESNTVQEEPIASPASPTSTETASTSRSVSPPPPPGLRVRARKGQRRTKGVAQRAREDEGRVHQRFVYLMDKLFFEELGIVPIHLRRGVSPLPVELPETFPAAWLTINKPRKFKKLVRRNSVHPLSTIPEVDIEEEPSRNARIKKLIFHKIFVRKTDDEVRRRADEMVLERAAKVRPGTPIVDINAVDSDASQEDSDEDEAKFDYSSIQGEMTDIEDEIEDEQYDDQEDSEIMECFKSESDDDPMGDSPRIDSAEEEREESVEMTAIDAAATVPEAPTIPAGQVAALPDHIKFEGATEAEEVSSDEAADEEVMRVFGQNLSPPEPYVFADPYPPLPLEEKPVSVVQSDEEMGDVTVAEEAFDCLLRPTKTEPVPIVIPPEITRPERLLDLLPPDLIFEGVDYSGLTDAEKEEALDRVVTERQRIREELLRPQPKLKTVHQLVHEEPTANGRMKEIIAFEFCDDTDSDSAELEEWAQSMSPEKILEDPRPPSEANSHIIFTSGRLEVAPPTPPPKRKNDYMPCRDQKLLDSKIRWWRDDIIETLIEDEAWRTLLDYLKCDFFHNSYGRKPIVYVPHLNLVRGMPNHYLKTYINQMRIRRWQENDLMETLEEQNHLFRLKKSHGAYPTPMREISRKRKREPEPCPELTISFADPPTVVSTRIYNPVRSAPKGRSILKIRPPSPEVITPEPVEEPREKKIFPSCRFIFKKTPKKIELPNPDDTRFPTEQEYDPENARRFRFEAQKYLLRPGTQKYKTRFIYKCRGIPGIVHMAMNEQKVKKEFIKDTSLLGGFYFMRSKERIAVLRAVGLCDYKSDQIAELLEARRKAHENPFALALMSLIMGQGTYTLNFLARVHRDGWYDHRIEDRRVRAEADGIVRYCMLFIEYRAESQRLSEAGRNALRRGLLEKYLTYKQLEDACIFTRCIMAFLLTLAYSETRHFVDDVVLCKQVPMMFRVAFSTLFCETTGAWQQTMLELLKELSPHDIQRFPFTGVGRHPDSINAILEFAKHTSDVQFASFLLIVGECFDVQPFVKSSKYYERRADRLLDPRREIYKYWFALNNEMEGAHDREGRLKVYPELIKCQSALLGYTLKHDLFHILKEKARPPMEQVFPVALLYPQIDMEILDEQAYEVMRHYAYVLQVTNNWIAAAQVMHVTGRDETLGVKARFEAEIELACSFCCTTLSYGRKKARLIKKEEKRKLDEARDRHMEAQKKRMEQGLAPLPFTGGKVKGPLKDIPDDVDTKIRPIACLACRKPLPRCAICFNHMFNPVANEDGLRGEQVGFGFAACRRCHHGGHPDHLDIWFKENYRCPVAKCNCECDYDNYWDTLTLHESLDFKLLGAPQLALGVHQGPERVVKSPDHYSDMEDEQIDEEEDEIDEEERDLDEAREKFCYGRISID